MEQKTNKSSAFAEDIDWNSSKFSKKSGQFRKRKALRLLICGDNEKPEPANCCAHRKQMGRGGSGVRGKMKLSDWLHLSKGCAKKALGERG